MYFSDGGHETKQFDLSPRPMPHQKSNGLSVMPSSYISPPSAMSTVSDQP